MKIQPYSSAFWCQRQSRSSRQGVCVDLEDNAILGAGAQHLLDVDVVTRSPQQLTPPVMWPMIVVCGLRLLGRGAASAPSFPT
jgi:hypothetical protein